MTIFMALCAGLGLAAACGLRVFLPLFVASIAVRAGFLGVGAHFDWLGSNAAIVLFGTATVVEVAGFMVPWVDHVLDLLAAPLAAVAGAVLMTSQLLGATAGSGEAVEPLLHPAVAWGLGIVVGATTASGVEAASIAGRLSSSVLTIGWLNPIYGMVETALSLAVTLLAVVVPVLAGLLVLLLLPVLAAAVWRILAWRARQRRQHEAKLQRARERIAYAMSHHSQRSGAAPQGGLGPDPGQPGPG
jgi:hypothetical protein